MAALSFANETELILWIRSAAGTEVRKKLELDRPPVVIETEAGGHFTVYGDHSRVVVSIVERPDVPDSAAAKADEYVELQLSPFFRESYWPGKILGRGVCRGPKPSELAERNRVAYLCEALETIGKGGGK